MPSKNPVNGSCLCGKISLSVAAFERHVVACHCRQCRKQTGTYVSAAAVSDDNLKVCGAEHLTWYAASDMAQRGFCSGCGSLLFWKRNGSNSTSVMAGCFDSPTGLELIAHIYTADKGDYYSIADGVPQFTRADRD